MSSRRYCGDDTFDIVCLVTNPLRYDKKGQPIITPARKIAAEFNIPVSDKEDVHSQEFFDFLFLIRPDLLFVCDFGQILPQKALAGSILGGINLHGSLLPRLRGAAPVHWAIISGEQYTGVSIIHMTPKVDAGPVIAQSPPIPIGARETVEELEERLADYGAELVFDVALKMASNQTIKIIEQLHGKASKAPRFKKENGRVNWSGTSREIFNHYRAMQPWPRTFTNWIREDGSELCVILGLISPLDNDLRELIEEDYLQKEIVDPLLADAKMNNLADLLSERYSQKTPERSLVQSKPAWWRPGVVIKAESGELMIAASDGVVRIVEIQPTGKKMMPVKDFLLGYHIKTGEHFE
ncbi:methionyl-tRNA formyltransferase [Planctomycetales bacterium]|nr:methionyl-tRNA formyltransferase [Planctomycetales bacterium]